MNALIVFAHPNPDSFNGAVLKTVKQVLDNRQVEYTIKDLYQMNWNPVLSMQDIQQLYSGQVPNDIAQEHEAIRKADTLIFIYPIWWYEQPAILKGWLDKVFSHGFAYRVTDQGMIEGLLTGKKAMAITTSGANKDNMVENGIEAAIQTSMIKGTLGFSGIQPIEYRNLYAVPTVSDTDRQQMLKEVEAAVGRL